MASRMSSRRSRSALTGARRRQGPARETDRSDLDHGRHWAPTGHGLSRSYRRKSGRAGVAKVHARCGRSPDRPCGFARGAGDFGEARVPFSPSVTRRSPKRGCETARGARRIAERGVRNRTGGTGPVGIPGAIFPPPVPATREPRLRNRTTLSAKFRRDRAVSIQDCFFAATAGGASGTTVSSSVSSDPPRS
jgi:hypothetical protein